MRRGTPTARSRSERRPADSPARGELRGRSAGGACPRARCRCAAGRATRSTRRRGDADRRDHARHDDQRAPPHVVSHDRESIRAADRLCSTRRLPRCSKRASAGAPARLEGSESATKIRRRRSAAVVRASGLQAALNAKSSGRARLIALPRSLRALAVQADIARPPTTGTPCRPRSDGTAWLLGRRAWMLPSSGSRGRLDADTALVEYQLGATRSYAWVIDRQSITSHTLASSAGIGRSRGGTTRSSARS